VAPPAEDDDMTIPLLLLASMFPADASASLDGTQPQEAEVDDLTDLQGTWEMVAIIKGGKDVTKEDVLARLICRGRDVAALNKGDQRPQRFGTILGLDHSRSPAAIDFLLDDPKVVEPGIYRRHSDLLVWADEDHNRYRPTTFQSPKDTGEIVILFRRVR
jgi:uncharacterized protein (TIGR03067 family)